MMAFGPDAWKTHVQERIELAKWFEQELQKKETPYFRVSFSNIIAIRANCIPSEVASQFGLIPDDYTNPVWYKIILMPHVSKEKLIQLIDKMK